eukprot:m.41255 g.41255  ORF g.41255 m.41255 type:complete len:214 (+) comp10537_c0_seq1:295-936(+)
MAFDNSQQRDAAGVFPKRKQNQTASEHFSALQRHAADTVDFFSLGEKCAVKDCRLTDYLPFKCDKCGLTTCQDHLASHKCTEPEVDRRLPTCPMCQQEIVLRAGLTLDTCVDQHIRSGCKRLTVASEAKARKASKQRCQKHGCRVKPMVPIHCDKCHKSFCTSHRLSFDHKCIPTPVRAATAASTHAASCRTAALRVDQEAHTAALRRIWGSS